MSDLLQASAVFRREAAELRSVMPAGGSPCPDCGGDGVDGSLRAVLELIGALHLQAAGVIDSDAGKLRKAHDVYAGTEESLTRLSAQITGPDAIR